MTLNINKIVIVGGGSAGWMSAATFIKAFPEKEILVVESAEIPRIGVGESTTSEFVTWLKFLDIDRDEFMRETDAAFKLGLGFTNFKTETSPTFFFPFGHAARQPHVLELNDWPLKKYLYPETDNRDFARYYWPADSSFYTNKIVMEHDESFGVSYRPERDLAFQIDANKFAIWLYEKYCTPKGVKRILGTVNKIIDKKDGTIESIVLEDGTEIHGDLFVDCTGFKSLLLGQHLDVPFISTKDNLPNNKAYFAPVQYTDKDKEMQTFTNATALKNGWAWNTPLWSRIGTGYIYSDEFISDEDALQEFKDYLDSDKMAVYNPNRSKELNFKHITVKNGYYEKCFVGNVLAIGLSAAFLEPLESTGLLFVHGALLDFCGILSNRGAITSWDIETFNRSTITRIQNTFDFVTMHFQLTQRDDSQYWNRISSREFNNSIIDLNVKSYIEQKMDNILYMVIATQGFDYYPLNKWSIDTLNHLYKINVKEELDPIFAEREKMSIHWRNIVNSAETHYEILKKIHS
jgi:tryptophan halogenase